MTTWEHTARNRIGDAPGDDPVERLRHVVVAFADMDTEDRVITATSGLYPEQDWTGLTHGDLRALLARFDN